MLSLTRKTDYALVALVHLVRAADRISSARELSEIYRIPFATLTNILKTLARHDIVESVRGAQGGYRLTAHPRDITMDRVVSAVEGPIRLFLCSNENDQPPSARCEQQPGCPMAKPAQKMSQRFHEFLKGMTLEEIAADTPEGATGDRNEHHGETVATATATVHPALSPKRPSPTQQPATALRNGKQNSISAGDNKIRHKAGREESPVRIALNIAASNK
jgi:Rrf2 family protein